MEKAPIETFEHDIADEIRQKEASIADIASAVGDISNSPKDTDNHRSSVIIGVVIVLVLCGIIGVVVVGYLYSTGKFDPFAPSPKVLEEMKKEPVLPSVDVSSLSPTLGKNIGSYLTAVKKTKDGYIITIASYSPVFSYMLKNENDYADELGKQLNPPTSKPKVPSVPTPAQGVVASSSNSTSTQVATGTTTSDTTNELSAAYVFSDITINNQNMRIATSASGTLVYAFIGTQNLVISSSTDGILSLRSSILVK